MAIPSKIGRYEIKSELGRGGMATVYRAYDPSFDREVAIKVLPREMLHDPQFRSRFERELKIVAGLEHPAIVPVYDVGEEDGQPYFVMRYMSGGSLSAEIEKGSFSLQDSARIISRIAEGLAYAHKKGIVHRDLKPDNILFDDAGDPFISDFGVAKLTESTGSLTGSGIIGTPAYMSPEQAQGSNVDSRSDVYGLGVMAYQMLSGDQPYHSDTPMGVVVKHITEPVPEILKVMPSLPQETDAVIKTAMAKDRNSRYQTTIELAKGLNKVAFGNEGNLASTPSTGPRTGVFKSASTSSSSNRTGLIIAAVVVLVLLAVAFFFGRQFFAPPPPAPILAPTLNAIPTEASPVQQPPPATQSGVSSVLPFAPVCAQPPQLPLPKINDIDKFCVKKVPYTTISIPENATFEVRDPKFSCHVESTKDNRTILSCTGPQLQSVDIKVCMTPPTAPSSDLSKCPQGATYNSANQCCMPPPPPDAGCVPYKVNIRGCS